MKRLKFTEEQIAFALRNRKNRDSAYYFVFLGLPCGNAFNRRLILRSSLPINAASPQGRPVIEHFLISFISASSLFSRKYLRQLLISSSK